MNSYSQNREDLFVLDYFKGFKGTLLEIGANDGRTLSNSLLLIENGWNAYVLEPGSVCGDLFLLHKDNCKVHVFNYGIGERDEVVKFYESGTHVSNGSDKGLVSSTHYNETLRWRKSGVQFTEREIQLVSFENFYNSIENPVFDFISIDAEGHDWTILKHIDLKDVRCLVIEFNGDNELQARFSIYCASYGLKLAIINNENLIFVR
ncbi:FkbM family methyltransferase [Mucilaginibacter xinganensis]|uniref:Methyltransferase FkbM domain-containing protein n=1 Tax=Mucilaginibacter xinganensis TaxID=1234841 RepID=A0A223NXT1_9SPHI|nr:FkbM family methyltransferase [Mucilaginibacter xinganensis]ASU34398.1 hypothetical protein MuYL_2511 [Mucilaginibacter xinganensis]